MFITDDLFETVAGGKHCVNFRGESGESTRKASSAMLANSNSVKLIDNISETKLLLKDLSLNGTKRTLTYIF